MRRTISDESGAAAIEFSMIAPVLILTAMAGLEFGLVITTQATMQHSARDTVRQISLGQLSDTNAPAYVCSKVTSWATSACTAAVTHSNAADPKSDVITIMVSVPASSASIVNLFTRTAGGFNVKASAAMRREDVL